MRLRHALLTEPSRSAAARRTDGLDLGRAWRNRTRAYNCLMPTVSASEARQTLPAQLDRVEAGEQVAITRHGRVVAVMVRPDALRSSRTADAWGMADVIAERLAQARAHPSASTAAAISAERAEELVRAADRERADRSER